MRLAETVLSLERAGVVDLVVEALQHGRLSSKSGEVAIAGVAGGRAGVDSHVSALLRYWDTELPGLSGPEFSKVVGACIETARELAPAMTNVEVVWSGPRVQGSFLRSTRQVVKELIVGAKSELLVVGYWLSGREEEEGVVQDIVGLLASAVSEGRRVVVALDERPRKNSKTTNFDVLDRLWPADIELPERLAWQLPRDDGIIKLHAKVLVADRTDALVSSANLTRYGMDHNMEMGIRIAGVAAEKIADHFDHLRSQEILVPVGAEA